MQPLLIRTDRNDHQTEGILIYKDGKSFQTLYTLELPWLDNQRRVSCIPEGTYQVLRHTSPKFGNCFWLQDVPDRSAILIHAGNYYQHTLGCILLGTGKSDVNKDGLNDVIYSRHAMQRLLAAMPDSFNLKIEELRSVKSFKS